jgi:tetratricopeptide (TPR) repeat protein
MDMLESRLESSSPARVAGIAIKVIGSPSRTDDDLKRLVAIVGKAAAIHSNSIELLLLYGDVLNWTGKVDQSLACYDAVLSQIPDHPIAINNRAFLLCIYNRDAAAGLAALHNLIKLHGPLGSYLDTRGLAYLATRQPEKAVADFEYAVRDMEDGERLFHLAKAYKALDRMDDAVRTMSRAIELGAEARFMHPRERADFEALYAEVRKRIDK